MYERRSARPLSRRKFARRILNHFLAASALVAASLIVGMLGYEYFEDMGAADSFLEASMLLGGMGPLHTPVTLGGKIFAGLFALYSGILFLVTAGVVFAPVLHRVLHRFHWAEVSKKD